MESTNVCALCQNHVSQKSYTDKLHTFCCAGCQAVYQILSVQNALDNFKEHPLFRQALTSGIISNPHLIEEMRKSEDVNEIEHEKLFLEISDLWCPSCTKVITWVLKQQKGIKNCTIDYATDLASIEYSPRFLSKEKILKIIGQLGYQGHLLQDAGQVESHSRLFLRFIIAAFCSLNIMMFAYPIYAQYFHTGNEGYSSFFVWLSLFSSLPVISYCAWPIWKRLFTALSVGYLGMETLVMIGVVSSFALSIYGMMSGSDYVYFDTMTVIITFVLLGKIIESKAKFSAKDSLIRLAKGLPRRGRKRFDDGSEKFVPIKDIMPGDTIIIMTGEKIVLDGKVVTGEGACNESIMTGESLPVIKKIGSLVLSGSILQHGYLVVEVGTKLEESILVRIIGMIEQEIGHKSQYTRKVDSIIKWFVPLIITLAAMTGVVSFIWGFFQGGNNSIEEALVRAISVILISCPCAIGIAAPLAEAHLLNALAKWGVIVRNRGCIQELGRETIFIFDKTGTITEGKFTLIEGLENLSLNEKQALKGLVICSNHPIALAINQAIELEAHRTDSMEEISGRGLRGWINQDVFYLGSKAFLEEQGIKVEEQNLESPYTRTYFAKNDICLGCLVLGDKLKNNIKEVITSLQPTKTILLSGDSHPVVESIAKQCHFDAWKAECNPLQKKEYIDRLRLEGNIVAVVGDGINDAPALTAANIGVAVVCATDISIQVSDLLLTKDSLEVLPKMREVARRGQKIIKQNIFWAFFYNVIGIVLAMFGLLSPIFAASAMVVSSLIVLLNAQRVAK